MTNSRNTFAPQAQAETSPKKQPLVLSLRAQYIDKREGLPNSDVTLLRLGLSKADRQKHRADRVEVVCYPDDRPIEIIDGLLLTVTGTYEEPWGSRTGRILEADAEIVERETRPSIKLDGLPSATCQRVHDLCGCDPADDLPRLEQVLAASKFSKAKQALILAAYEAEAEARKSDTPAISRLIGLFVQAGESRSHARELATDFNPKLSPYQFLFSARQKFLKADQFAKLYSI